jgi:uncharacterized membrane-anchored protein YhcB (DUF1043 family)
MNGIALTFADIQMLVGVAIGGILLWWRVETRVSSGAIKAQAKAEQVEKDFNAFKLEVAKNYATNGFIRDVEERLGERFDKIVAELHGMRSDFQKAMVDMAKNSNSRRRT